MEVSLMEYSRWPLKKHEPFQQCCNTVSFWFKNTHTLTNAKCTHYQILRSALPRTTGESFNAASPQGCPNTPTLFPDDSFHVLFWSLAMFLVCRGAVQSQVLHSCSFQTKPRISLCLSGDCSYNTDPCLLARYSLWTRRLFVTTTPTLCTEALPQYTHRHSAWYAF